MTKTKRSPGNHRSGKKSGREGKMKKEEEEEEERLREGETGRSKEQDTSLYDEETAGPRLRRTGSSHYRRSSSSTRLPVLVARHANVERPARSGLARCTCSCSYTPFISYGRSAHARVPSPVFPDPLLCSRCNLGSRFQPLVLSLGALGSLFSSGLSEHVPLVFFFVPLLLLFWNE